MAHGVGEVLDEEKTLVQVLGNQPSPQQAPVHLAPQQPQPGLRKSVGVMGSRRIFTPSFKLKVLDSYRYDIDCKGNQRATARKYGIHRRQIQKWLQCEESLRKLVTESKHSPTVQPGIGIVAPAGSPNAKVAPAVSPGVHEPRRPQQQPNHGAPASAPLNSGTARLHGDELPVQQQQQQHSPPPPPQSAPVAAQALATSHQQVAAAHAAAAAAAAAAVAAAAVANYRFHGAATGYPDLKDKVPVAMQPAQYPQGSAADYYELYQAAAAAAAYRHSSPPAPMHHHHHQQQQHHHHQQQHQNQRYASDLHRQQRTGSFPAHFDHTVESSSEPEQPQRHYAALLAPTEIKSERASPDSLATSVTYECTASTPQPPKKERLDEDEEHRHEEEHSSSSNCSPLSSHSESIEALPLSPEVSASSDSEMDLPQTEVGCNGSDQIRRRSFPVRFKLEVLDAFHNDGEVAGNQRATARKYRINRRQVQKWLSQESELRGVVELCGNNRQRLGPGCTPEEITEKKNLKETALENIPVDLRTGMLTTDLCQVSPHSRPHSNYNSEFSSSLSPNNYIDSSLTPPYSAPGCSFSCCQDITPTCHPHYYCYSPGESAAEGSLKRPLGTQSCYPQAKKACYEENALPPEKKEPVQETPLCLVKSKRPESAMQVEPVTSTVPSPPAAPAVAPAAASPPQFAKKSAILFKPYLDNPISKPSEQEDAPVNNNCQEAWNLNERNNVALDVSMRLPSWRSNAPQHSPSQQQSSPPLQQPSPPLQQPPTHQYLEYSQVKSAFVRYPSSTNVHYS